jgi:RES domain-containing protein
MQVWRLTKTKYAPTAFDGEGARLYGARWTSVGTRVAYAASNSALAVLEVLVHVENVDVLASYSLLHASLPDALIQTLDAARLPNDWHSWPAPPAAQAVGDAWILANESLALSVPSALVPGGTNLLINPANKDFPQFVVERVEPFDFDRRLIR